MLDVLIITYTITYGVTYGFQNLWVRLSSLFSTEHIQQNRVGEILDWVLVLCIWYWYNYIETALLIEGL